MQDVIRMIKARLGLPRDGSLLESQRLLEIQRSLESQRVLESQRRGHRLPPCSRFDAADHRWPRDLPEAVSHEFHDRRKYPPGPRIQRVRGGTRS